MNFVRLFRNLKNFKDERKRRIEESSDIMDLADMYGSARHFGDQEEMALINDRMNVVMREQGLTSKEGASHG